MKKSETVKYKFKFKEDLKRFTETLLEYVSTDNGDWTVKGFIVKDFDFFVAEKWEIASDNEGSSNTANIGSITNIEDLRNGNGIFANLGEEWFDEYMI